MSIGQAVILAAGEGTKMWPYGVTQPKGGLPVGASPLLVHTLKVLEGTGIKEATVLTGHLGSQLRQTVLQSGYRGSTLSLSWMTQLELNGTAGALDYYLQEGQVDGDLLVVYGDVLTFAEDLESLCFRHLAGGGGATVMVSSLNAELPNDWICARVADGRAVEIVAHPRGGVTHRLSGAFVLSPEVAKLVAETGEYGSRVQVGVMPKAERDLSTTLQLALDSGCTVDVVETVRPCVDLDKPWHLLEANKVYVTQSAGSLRQNHIPDSAYVDPAARLEGYIQLGEYSRIEGPCLIKGNLLCGSHTVIHNGATLQGDTVVGDRCSIGNYCLLAGDAVVGDRCVIDHAAEFDGVLMENVYLYHYMEITGIVGRSTDVGAGSVCGTLRFDDGVTTHRVKGRAERPQTGANVAYIGDACRLGVNTILMPGVKIGPYSLVGPGVILDKDVPERTSIFVKQTHSTGSWGPERYGW